jgi:hypothetical protein
MVDVIDAICQSIVAEVEGAVACGVVDVTSGELLGGYNDEPRATGMSSAIARAAMDLASANQRDDGVAFHDVHVTSDNSDQFAKAIDGGRALVMLVTRRATNIGMGWAQVNAAIPRLEQHLATRR